MKKSITLSILLVSLSSFSIVRPSNNKANHLIKKAIKNEEGLSQRKQLNAYNHFYQKQQERIQSKAIAIGNHPAITQQQQAMRQQTAATSQKKLIPGSAEWARAKN